MTAMAETLVFTDQPQVAASSAAAWVRDMLTAGTHLSALAVADDFAAHLNSALLALGTDRL
jgi:hypothetical protein